MKITEYTVQAGLKQPRTIALAADLHDRPFDRVIDKMRAVSPDYIMISGDLTNRKSDKTLYVPAFLTACVRLAPTFYSRGNHEWRYDENDARSISETGTVLLDNSYVHVDGLCVGGLTSGFMGSRFERRYGTLVPKLSWLKNFEAEPGYKILLCHHPEYFPLYLRGRNIDLVLSGHAHGGQIRIFNHGLFAPGQGVWPKYTAGMHEGKMIISTGLANTGGIIPRINNETELVVIKLI